MANCKECKENRVEVKTPENVPYIVYEAAMARNEREKKRLWILAIVSWVVTLLIVGIFTYERLQYDYSGTYEEVIVDAEDDGNANYIGQDGNIYNGEDSSTEDYEN